MFLPPHAGTLPIRLTCFLFVSNDVVVNDDDDTFLLLRRATYHSLHNLTRWLIIHFTPVDWESTSMITSMFTFVTTLSPSCGFKWPNYPRYHCYGYPWERIPGYCDGDYDSDDDCDCDSYGNCDASEAYSRLIYYLPFSMCPNFNLAMELWMNTSSTAIQSIFYFFFKLSIVRLSDNLEMALWWWWWYQVSWNFISYAYLITNSLSINH